MLLFIDLVYTSAIARNMGSYPLPLAPDRAGKHHSANCGDVERRHNGYGNLAHAGGETTVVWAFLRLAVQASFLRYQRDRDCHQSTINSQIATLLVRRQRRPCLMRFRQRSA